MDERVIAMAQDRDSARADLAKVQAEVEALRVENERLRSALQPFADLQSPPLDAVGGGTLFAPSIRIQLVKEAHAALTPEGAKL